MGPSRSLASHPVGQAQLAKHNAQRDPQLPEPPGFCRCQSPPPPQPPPRTPPGAECPTWGGQSLGAGLAARLAKDQQTRPLRPQAGGHANQVPPDPQAGRQAADSPARRQGPWAPPPHGPHCRAEGQGPSLPGQKPDSSRARTTPGHAKGHMGHITLHPSHHHDSDFSVNGQPSQWQGEKYFSTHKCCLLFLPLKCLGHLGEPPP